MNDFTLIANSGIQYLTCKLDIDLTSNHKVFFHEWFDEDNVQQALEFAYSLPADAGVYRWADLQKREFINDEGKLLCQNVNYILSDPNLKALTETKTSHFYHMKFTDKVGAIALQKMLNQWIPVPFLEESGSKELKLGPYNWCRCKIIPTEITDEKIKANILFAFDTRSLYAPNEECDQEEVHEFPYFESSSEDKKTFRFCNKKSLLLNFCNMENQWVGEYIMKLVHGVTDLTKVPFVGGNQFQFLAMYMLLMEYIGKNANLPAVTLFRDRDVQKINVEMIIDIGNSRTAAILYEQNFTKVQMLRLQNFEDPVLPTGLLNRTQESFDMGVAFQQISYGRKPFVNSNQFVWPSIVRLGAEASHLKHQTINIAKGDEIFSTYSSPKRYLWDSRRRREEWRCVNLSQDGQNEIPIIEGISNYFEDDGKLSKEGWGYGNHYSRKTLMTFAFMEIMAQANVQINSFDYRTFLGKPATPRIIDKIILTCPTGMSKNEQVALHQCVKDALYVMRQFYTNNDATYKPIEISLIPDLDNKATKGWIFDEATCSQFVYLYGLFSETYKGQSEEFFRMYGTEYTDSNGKVHDTLRIGSLDIGAGTSDIMLCDYERDIALPTRFKPQPVFWDSFDTAGDDMLRQLISTVLLQGKDSVLENAMLQRGWDEAQFRSTLYHFVGGNHREKSFVDQVMRRDFNTQVLVPIMYHYLALHTQGETYAELKYDDLFAKDHPSDEVLATFKQHFGLNLSEIVWVYDKKRLSHHIEHAMDDLLGKIGDVIDSYAPNLLLLSGRPTSLEPIKTILCKHLSLSPNRVIVLNKYRIGRWYPFANEFGYLNNSKSVVPTGAMIGYLASHAGGYNGFSLDLSVLGEKLTPTTDNFLVNNATANVNKCFITPKQNVGIVCPDSFPVYIGSKQHDLSNYPIRPFYVLDFDEDDIIRRIKRDNQYAMTPEQIQQAYDKYTLGILSNSPLRFTIEREDAFDAKEILRIVEVENSNGDMLNVKDFSLSIQSLNDPECYWLDSGSFEINIKA